MRKIEIESGEESLQAQPKTHQSDRRSRVKARKSPSNVEARRNSGHGQEIYRHYLPKNSESLLMTRHKPTKMPS